MKRQLKTHLKVMKNTNKEKLLTVATWCPVFTGYYHSIFNESDRVIDSEQELSESEYKEYYDDLFNTGVTYEFFQNNLWEYVSFSEAFKEASRSIAHALPSLDCAGVIKDTDFESLQSPREYNFNTDSINLKVTFSPKKLEKYLNENLVEFTEYIQSRYTSRSGFSSWYSNDVTDWLDISEYGAHEVGSVLQFVIFNEYGDESEAEMALYENSYCYEDFHNYRELDTEGMIEAFNNQKKAV